MLPIMSSHQRPIRVAVVNDYEIVVVGIAGILDGFAERVAVVELDSNLPVVSDVDVLLYDSFGQPQGAAMPLREIVGDGEAKVLVISWNTDPDLVETALRSGADGYVSKGITGEELVAAIEAVYGGAQVRPPAEVADDRFGSWPGQELGLAPREAEILALICQGMSNQEIADRAYLSGNTIKSYIRSLYRKIGVDTRTRALLWGLEHGFRPDRVRHRRDASAAIPETSEK